MRRTAGFFQQLTECEAVGIRLKDGDDFPYFETRGFTEDFVKLENSLCAYNPQGEMLRDEAGHPVLDCMCGNIISGRFVTSKPFFTPRGSFWSSCTSELLANSTDADLQAKARNRCNGDGYESVALLPLRSHGEAYGLIQFNDRRPGRFTAEKIDLYENLVDYFAIALSKLKMEEELEENELRFRTLADSGQALVWLSGTDKLCNYFNKPWLHFTGRTLEQELGNGWAEGVHPDDFDSCLHHYVTAFDKRETFSIEYRLRRVDGDYRWLQDDGMPRFDRNGNFIGYIGHCLDITARKQSAEEQRTLQEQLYQSQKMEAVGHLASGVAHDFNNILTVICGYCSLLKMDMDKNSPHLLKVDEIAQAADRAATLTHSLLAFSRKQIMNLRTIDLNQVVSKVDTMLRRIIGEDIHLTVALSNDPLHVIIDDLQIEQVLINLAANARDAMPQGGGLTILSEYGETVEESMTTDKPCDPGCYAILTVTDSGSGIDGEIQKRIFEPFFTTKELGRGTGLGLSIVYGIVKQHGGYIYVSSEPGSGTRFRMYLPIDAGERKFAAEKVIQEDILLSGSETILVVEDEEPVRNILKAALVRYGYTVLPAVDGQDAVETFAANRQDIKLVLMDVIMPRKNGKAASEEIARLKKDVKFLFSSGYAADIIKCRCELGENAEVITKPADIHQLLGKIREMLDRDDAG